MLTQEQHTALLETFFFQPIDQGQTPQETPLFRHFAGKESLIATVKLAYALDEAGAKEALEAAYEEVRLE